MTTINIKSRRVFRRTDDYTPGSPKLELTHESLPSQLSPTSVLIKVHAVSLNYRDANIVNGGNPWPVIPHGIPCNDAAGEVIATGTDVKTLNLGDRVAPVIDTENITGRESTRSWLAADEDGVLADYLIFDERVLSILPSHLSWAEACLIPCAGTTAWAALEGFGMGKSVLIQGLKVTPEIQTHLLMKVKGTGGVSMFALKLARAAGLQVILSSSSDEKLQRIKAQFPGLPLPTVNYKSPTWHEDVLSLTNGAGVDLVLEMGGTGSLVQSIKCARRGGTVSQIGYLGRQDPSDLAELLPVLIDRRANLR